MSDTAIEWTDKTWNPTTGCDRVSLGCDHCYAMTLAPRLKAMGAAKYQNDGDPKTSGPGFGITEHASVLKQPLSWRKPAHVFVNSMSDLFHDGVSDGFIWSVFVTMAQAQRHTFQVLTKRHGRMRSLLNRWAADGWIARDHRMTWNDLSGYVVAGALPNVWLGVSVEDQKWADLRVPALLNTPAAVRFLSCEPLLGPVDLRAHLWPELGLHWVIVGGESGSGARPMHPDWPASVRDQCTAVGVSYFFKQWGEYGLFPRGWHDGAPVPMNDRGVTVANDGTVYQPGDLDWPDGPRRGEAYRADHGRAHLHAMYRVGKHEAGRDLDGRTWDEFPRAAS